MMINKSEASFQTSPLQEMKIEFREHFRNITRVIDCVGCDKCKLWGKLQVLHQINE